MKDIVRFRVFLIIVVLILAAGACTQQQPAGGQNNPTPTSTPETVSAATTSPSAIVNDPAATPPDLPVVPSPTLVRIAFLDPANGWGVASNNGGYLLRTVDGGRTWLNATPQGLTGIGYPTVLAVLDAATVWALAPNVDFYTGALYHTTDGGLSWTSTSVPFGGASLQFLDALTGRALSNLGVGLGSNAVEMYQTSDGGVTWLSVFNDHPSRSNSSDTLPFGGIKNGMTFLDANTGWVTGSRPMPGDIYLFLTRDGGISWSQQGIPLPAGYGDNMYMAQAPVFFGNDGFLPLLVYLSNTTVFTFYSTRDGGLTWTGDPANAAAIIPPCTYAFADALHAWCWDSGTTLYSTSDGARTWSGTPANLDLGGRLQQMEFLPASGGHFTGWALTNVDDSGHSQLYTSTDNGVTWTPLIP